MTTISKFSDICGENVQLSQQNTTASWTPKSSGGQAYCESELLPGQTVTVRVEGSGRCDVGFLKGDPESSVPATFKTLNEIRAHRRTCDIPITFNSKGEEVSSSFQDKKFKKNVEKGDKIRIAVNLQYGQMQIEILSNGSSDNSLKFKSQGANIQLDNNNTRVSPICKNPASICIIAEKLVAGQTLRFACSPINEGSRPPGRYGFELLVSGKDPNFLSREHGYLFDALKTREETSGLIKIESFEKEDCSGPFQVKLSEDSTIQYIGPTGKKNEQRIAVPTSQGVWVVLDLYRVSISTIKDQEREGHNDVDSGAWNTVENSRQALDVPDSLPLQPRPARPLTVVPPDESLQTTENNILTRLEGIERQIQNVTANNPGQSSAGLNVTRRLENLERHVGHSGGAKLDQAKEHEVIRRLDSLEKALNNLKTFSPTRSVEGADIISRLERVEEALIKPPRNISVVASPTQESSHRNKIVEVSPTQESTNIANADDNDELYFKKSFVTLVRDLQTMEFCDHLYAKEILTFAQLQRIQAMVGNDRADANRQILHIVEINKHKIKKSDMVEILTDINQIHLIEHFYQKKGNK